MIWIPKRFTGVSLSNKADVYLLKIYGLLDTAPTVILQ